MSAARAASFFRAKALLVAALLGLLFAPAPAGAAARDPAEDWRTLKTEHFAFHHPGRLADAVSRLADYAEKIRPEMIGLLGYDPPGRVDVSVIDETDEANGYATVAGPNRITLFASAPSFESTLADYDSWLAYVFVHEYAHILSLDNRRGYARLMERIFGRVEGPFTLPSALAWFVASPPNMFLPPWVVEGLAVNAETRITGRGRLNSTIYSMIYRAAVAEDAIPPLDRLGGDFPWWPSRSSAYIFGSRLMAGIADKGGNKALGEVFRRHGGRFPYLIENPPETVAGMDYRSLYQKMADDLAKEYGPIVERIKKEGATPAKTFTESGLALGGPRWLSGGRLVFTLASFAKPPSLVLLDTATGRARCLTERPGNLSRPTPVGGDSFVFPMSASERPWAGRVLHNQLYRADAASFFPLARKLTSGFRVVAADYSSAGGFYAAVTSDGPNRSLILLRPGPSGLEEKALLSEPGVRYDNPAVSPDGKRIAFARKEDGGTERIALLDLADSSVRLLTPASFRAGMPTFPPGGDRITFTADPGGIFDLYSVAAEGGPLTRITRVIGGAFAPDYSPDGTRIAFLSYSARGFDVAVMNSADAVGTTHENPSPELVRAPEAKLAAPAGRKSEPYVALPDLKPCYWLPDLSSDNAGLVPGAWSSAGDPLGVEQWRAGLFWSAGLKRPYGNLTYVNDAWYPTLTVDAWKTPVMYSNLLAGYDYWEEDRGASLKISQKFSWPLAEFALSVGYAPEEVVRLSRIAEDLGGYASLSLYPFKGRKDSVFIGAYLDTAFPRESDFSAAPLGGTRASAVLRVRDEALGADLNSRELTASLSEYFELPWPGGAVLALKGRGGFGWGDEIFQSLFQAGGASGDFPLRGYPSRVLRAQKLATGTAELALPLMRVYRGISDWPAYLRRIDLAPFYEAGRTFDTPWGDETKRAAGAELRFKLLLGYYVPVSVDVGYAHGFDQYGEDRGYVLLNLGGDAPAYANGHVAGRTDF